MYISILALLYIVAILLGLLAMVLIYGGGTKDESRTRDSDDDR